MVSNSTLLPSVNGKGPNTWSMRGMVKLRFDQYTKLFSDINYAFIIPDDSGLKGTLRQLAKASRRFTALPFDINNLSMCVSFKNITEVYPL